MIGLTDNSTAYETGDAFHALRRGLVRSRGFSLFVCVCDSTTTRDDIVQSLLASLSNLKVSIVDMSSMGDDLLTSLKSENPRGPVMIVGFEQLNQSAERAQAIIERLNLSRGDWPTTIPHPVAFWVKGEHLGKLLTSAPDFFDWRSDTIEFSEWNTAEIRVGGTRGWHSDVNPRLSTEDRDSRVLELEARIKASVESNHAKDIEARMKWWDEIADILQARGDLDQALRIRLEDQLPVYERLGEKRSLLVTRAKIAQGYWQRNKADDREKAISLLGQSIKAAVEMRLPAETVQLLQLADSISVDSQSLLRGIGMDNNSLEFLQTLSKT